MSRNPNSSMSNQWTGPPPPRPLAHRTYQNHQGSSSSISRRPVGSEASITAEEGTPQGHHRLYDGSYASSGGMGYSDDGRPPPYVPKEENSGGAEGAEWGRTAGGRMNQNWRTGGGAGDDMDERSARLRGPTGARGMPNIEEEISVPKDDVGRIIGKSGNTIKEIKASSGADVKVHSEHATVKIRGTHESVENAKLAIRKIIGGDGMVILRDIDEQSMGYLSKRMFLKDLQDQLGVQVEIDRRTLRIISSSGDTAMAEEARERIKERIEHRNVMDAVRIPIPRNTYKDINQDPLLQQLRDSKSITLEFRKDDQGTEVEIKGVRGVVEEAAEIIHTLVSGGGVRDYVNILPELLAECKQKKLDDLNADINRYVQGRGNVTVELKPQESRAVIAGVAEAVPHAKEELEKILEYYFAGHCLAIPISNEIMEDFCGDNDRNLNRMQSRDVMVSMDKEAGRLWLCGTIKGVETSREKIERDLARCRERHEVIYLENSEALGWIIGTRGDNIRRIEEKTGARVTVGDDWTVRIDGSDPQNVSAARRAVKETIHSFEEHKARSEKNSSSSSSGHRQGCY